MAVTVKKEYADLYSKIDRGLAINLASGVYVAGTIIVHDGTDGALADVDGSVGQRIGILTDDIDTATAENGVVALVFTGDFNLNKIVFSGAQDYETIGGALNRNSITLSPWEVY